MPRFRAYVESRSKRIFRTVLEQYPLIERFGPSASIDPDLFEDAQVVDLWDQLGLGSAVELEAAGPEEPEKETPDLSVSDDRYASVFALAERADLASEVRATVATAIELGLVPRPRESSVMIAPHAKRTRMLFTIWPQTGGGGRLSIYRWAPAIAEFFPGVEEVAARDALGPDGYGILERDDVPAFLGRLRSLLSGATQGVSGTTVPLSGEEIRAIADEWLRAVDPERHGVHYYEIAHAVERQGTVSGKNPMAAVLGVLRRHGRVFDQVGPGTYTWAATEPGAEADVGRLIRYWALRTDQKRPAELWEEIRAGRLRQGWGWDPQMDLEVIAERLVAGEKLSDWQQQAWGNRRMLTSQPDGIHVGDLVVVLHMPERSRFSLVRVVGPYQFDGGQVFGDYGHILPVKLLTEAAGIGYTDARLPVRLQSSLGNRIRLWNLDGFGADLERLTDGTIVTTD